MLASKPCLKYLTLIDTIALLHQHQRTLHTAALQGETVHYIQVEIDDIVAAGHIAGEVLGQSLDELSPQTRNLLGLLHSWVSEQVKSLSLPRDAYRFTRRDVRESIHWSDSQLSKHLQRLIDLEYVLVHRGRNGQRYVYELLYGGEGRQGQPFLMGLVDPSTLRESSTMTKTSTP